MAKKEIDSFEFYYNTLTYLLTFQKVDIKYVYLQHLLQYLIKVSCITEMITIIYLQRGFLEVLMHPLVGCHHYHHHHHM